MTSNDTLDKLEWAIGPRSGTDSAQWDWGTSCVYDSFVCHHGLLSPLSTLP